jgi:hypothetical protein
MVMVAAFCNSAGAVSVKYSSDRADALSAVLIIEAYEWDGTVSFNRSQPAQLDVRCATQMWQSTLALFINKG